MTSKADADEIAAFARGLASKLSLRGQRASWPLHLFRVDDVRAAASILNRGVLYPRSRAERAGLLTHDSAAPGVIEHTPDWCKDCVRLYFRPRTPTEYRSEGFRPRDQITMRAHRPVPVVFVFDSLPIITAPGTTFTEGNASTKGCRRGEDLAFLNTIPFDKVYHDTWISDDERDVVFRRCAEVLVANELALTHVKHVFCRSQAEYETLYSLLA
ncbi:MAG TPA: DarT ssDNA thymidine ADP-ribosyltransferase family protein, partial [Thermoanaerobaculia bacterium]|nr:DarT ssDNA thymidine ADP-ribosyltransferase family protein [Thermoanaerobaculia bacterium]